jgi:hypothetical protein
VLDGCGPTPVTALLEVKTATTPETAEVLQNTVPGGVGRWELVQLGYRDANDYAPPAFALEHPRPVNPREAESRAFANAVPTIEHRCQAWPLPEP